MKLIFYLLKCVVILIYLHTIFLEANAVTKLKNVRFFIPFENSRVLHREKKRTLKSNNIQKMEVQGNLFIDIGANLTDRMFDGVYSKKKHANDLQHVLNRAKKNNVEKIIITCTCLEDIDKSLKICETYDPEGKFLFLTAGVHPTNCYEFIDKNIMEEKDKQAKREFEEFINHFKNVKCAVAENPKRDDDNAKGHNANAADVQIKEEKKHSSETPQGDALKIPGFVYDKKEQDYLEKLKKKITNHSNRIVSIGEIGLDFDRLFFCPKYIQIKYFIYQLKLVQMFKLPIFLHMRNCSDIFFEILDKYKPLIEGVGGVIHSFTDREEIIEKINTYKNLYIGVNGCSLKTPENLSAVKRIPLNLLLLETDAPWCSIKKTHASYHFIQEKYEKRNYTNLKKIRNVIQCDDETIFKERNEPYNIVDIAEITYKVRGATIPFDSFCNKVRCNTLSLFKKLR
ncbi:TatD-like deoxyribonuclease, putative [Plasmodium vivax]|nr:TatD-like deoxyribonuclease, putative [Plasmodium vivax]SCO65086.1 TatD-like deoxyribonuclease, putative [Plasmodium vivax]SCO70576.1 TatD-like deoxyribonuclease, putative [Plasmodium vivax]VUZ93265.1 TatD-like deoxyribonuclease, putative [Plasmodium vivax]